jgi:hypothetical protein
MIDRSQLMLKSLLALLALLPSVLTVAKLISLPPSDEQVLRIAIVSASLVSAIVVFTCLPAIMRARPRTVLALVSGAFIAGLGSLLAWQYLDKRFHYEYSVEVEERRVTLPLSPGPLQSRYAQDLAQALENSNIGARLREEIDSRNDATSTFLTLLLVISQVGLTISILLGIGRLSDKAAELNGA